MGELKKGNGSDIWLVGGGQLNGALLQAYLIDGGIPMEKVFRLKDTKTYRISF